MNNLFESEIFSNISAFLQAEASELALSLILIFSVGFLVSRLSNYFVHEDRRRYHIKKGTRYITIIVATIWTLILYGLHNNDDSLFPIIVGIIVLGITITLRGIFTSIIGWMFITSGKGFHSGERIEVNGICGDVIDIGLLRTTIAEVGDWGSRGEQSTGRLVSIPNSIALDRALYNYSKGFDAIWNELSILITFESDWELAHKIVTEIAEKSHKEKEDFYKKRIEEVKRNHLVNYTYITPKVYTRIKDSGVELTLRHLVPVRERRIIEDQISQEILSAFRNEESVHFAYPTIRYYEEK